MVYSVEPGRGTCPASCGHTDPNHHGGTRTHDLGVASTKTADRSTMTTDRTAIATRTADRSRTTTANRDQDRRPLSPRSTILSAEHWSRQPLCPSEVGGVSFPRHSPPDWTRGCWMTHGHLPSGLGMRVMLALRSFAGGNVHALPWGGASI